MPRKKKAETEAVKTPAKAAYPMREEQIVVQFAGSEWDIAAAREAALAAYVAEGHRLSAVKSLRLYIKPEDATAYYVINGKATGSVSL